MPPPLNWPLLREKLARHTEALLADGYVVLDDFLGRACAHQLRDEMSRAPMSPNSTQFGTVRYSKPGVVECDLHGVPEAHLRREMPLFHELFEHCAQYDEPDLQCALEDASAASPTPLSLARGPRSTTIKLQRNVGGAFPLHYDNPAPPNKRCVRERVVTTHSYNALRVIFIVAENMIIMVKTMCHVYTRPFLCRALFC